MKQEILWSFIFRRKKSCDQLNIMNNHFAFDNTRIPLKSHQIIVTIMAL